MKWTWNFQHPDENKRNNELLHRLRSYDPYESPEEKRKCMEQEILYAIAA